MKRIPGIQAVVANPSTVIHSVDTPVHRDANSRVVALRFDKKKWKTPDAVRYTKGKFGSLRAPIKTSVVGNQIEVRIVRDRSPKEEATALNEDRGIYAVLGFGKVDASVDAIENPRKPVITTPVVKYIQENKNRTPKEMNVLLEQKFKLRLHPSTIWKIHRGLYPTSGGVSAIISGKKSTKEVSMKQNPLIAEIQANPSVSIYKTNWFKSFLRRNQGKSAYAITEAMNKQLKTLSPNIWQKSGKLKLGSKRAGYQVRFLKPGLVYGVAKKMKIALGFDPRMLRGMAKALYEGKSVKGVSQPGKYKGNIQAIRGLLRDRMNAIRAKSKRKIGKGRPASKLMQGAKSAFHPGTFPTAPKVRVKKAKKLKTKSKAVKKHKAKKRKGLGRPLNVRFKPSKRLTGVSQGYDVLDNLGAEDMMQLPIEKFDDIEAVADALNPLIRMPNVLGMLKKMGSQTVGVIPGAWALNYSDKLAEIITKLIPVPWLRNLVRELVGDGLVYAGAETFIPFKFEITKNAIQSVTLLKLLSNVSPAGFKLIPNIFGINPIFGKKPAIASHVNDNPDITGRQEDVLGLAEVQFPDGVSEIELSEGDVAALYDTVKQGDKLYGELEKFEPRGDVAEDLPVMTDALQEDAGYSPNNEEEYV